MSDSSLIDSLTLSASIVPSRAKWKGESAGDCCTKLEEEGEESRRRKKTLYISSFFKYSPPLARLSQPLRSSYEEWEDFPGTKLVLLLLSLWCYLLLFLLISGVAAQRRGRSITSHTHIWGGDVLSLSHACDDDEVRINSSSPTFSPKGLGGNKSTFPTFFLRLQQDSRVIFFAEALKLSRLVIRAAPWKRSLMSRSALLLGEGARCAESECAP